MGDPVRLGGQEFRIAGVVVEEPDRMTGSLNVGPRLMVSRGGLDRTGLIAIGSRAGAALLVALATAAPPVAQVRGELQKVFPRARIVDFRESHPLITRGLDDATVFLSLVSLIAMIVGAVGVATAMRSHLEQKMDSIAVMKSMGGRSGQILRIYLLQTAMLGAERQPAGHLSRQAGGADLPAADCALLLDPARVAAGPGARASGPAHGIGGDPAVHASAAAADPRHPPHGDPPAGHAGAARRGWRERLALRAPPWRLRPRCWWPGSA